MPLNLRGRSLITLLDYSAREIDFLVDTAIELKKMKQNGIYVKNLKHKNIAAIFLKPSCRTRGAFSVAAFDEGAHLENFTKEEIRFGVKESARDIARVLGRLFDAIAFRGYQHDSVVALARWSGVPVWNALCDKYHPTQVLADLMTIKERFGDYRGIKVAYVGDGRNNVASSLLIGCLKFDMDIRIVSPRELYPDKDVVKGLVARCRELDPEIQATFKITSDIPAGVKDCDVIYNDIWASMGEEHLIPERCRLLKNYKVTPQVMQQTGKPGAIYLHCLPALHDLETETARQYPELQEVSEEVFESSSSLVFDQAENRMHTIKAVMIKTLA